MEGTGSVVGGTIQHGYRDKAGDSRRSLEAGRSEPRSQVGGALPYLEPWRPLAGLGHSLPDAGQCHTAAAGGHDLPTVADCCTGQGGDRDNGAAVEEEEEGAERRLLAGEQELGIAHRLGEHN